MHSVKPSTAKKAERQKDAGKSRGEPRDLSRGRDRDDRDHDSNDRAIGDYGDAVHDGHDDSADEVCGDVIVRFTTISITRVKGGRILSAQSATRYSRPQHADTCRRVPASLTILPRQVNRLVSEDP